MNIYYCPQCKTQYHYEENNPQAPRTEHICPTCVPLVRLKKLMVEREATKPGFMSRAAFVECQSRQTHLVRLDEEISRKRKRIEEAEAAQPAHTSVTASSYRPIDTILGQNDLGVFNTEYEEAEKYNNLFHKYKKAKTTYTAGQDPDAPHTGLSNNATYTIPNRQYAHFPFGRRHVMPGSKVGNNPFIPHIPNGISHLRNETGTSTEPVGTLYNSDLYTLPHDTQFNYIKCPPCSFLKNISSVLYLSEIGQNIEDTTPVEIQIMFAFDSLFISANNKRYLDQLHKMLSQPPRQTRPYNRGDQTQHLPPQSIIALLQALPGYRDTRSVDGNPDPDCNKFRKRNITAPQRRVGTHVVHQCTENFGIYGCNMRSIVKEKFERIEDKYFKEVTGVKSLPDYYIKWKNQTDKIKVLLSSTAIKRISVNNPSSSKFDGWTISEQILPNSVYILNTDIESRKYHAEQLLCAILLREQNNLNEHDPAFLAGVKIPCASCYVSLMKTKQSLGKKLILPTNKSGGVWGASAKHVTHEDFMKIHQGVDEQGQRIAPPQPCTFFGNGQALATEMPHSPLHDEYNTWSRPS